MRLFGPTPSQWTNQEVDWLKSFAEAQILALGEAVHTSDGFYSAKIRLMKYLIEFHGYRAIALETPWGRALSAQSYIQGRGGSIEDALDGLFRVWRSTSVADFFQWLRTWNIEHPQDPVRFFGNDTQQPEWDLQFLLASVFLDARSKQVLKELFVGMYGELILQKGLAHLEARSKIRSQGFVDHKDNTSEIVALLESFSFAEDTLEFVACKSLIADTLQFSKDVHGTLKDMVQLRSESFTHRDQCMAELTLHFAKNDKTILWAHNLHICRPSEKIAEGLFYQGQFLLRALKENYKCIGLTAGSMEINWPWLKGHTRGPVLAETSIEKMATSLYPGASIFLTNKGQLNASSLSLSLSLESGVDVSDHFDGLVILPESLAIKYAVPVS
jgi:erythromycin esterase